MTAKSIKLHNNGYTYNVTLSDTHISIFKKWDVGPDPRDQVEAGLTFRLDDYVELKKLIDLYLPKE